MGRVDIGGEASMARLSIPEEAFETCEADRIKSYLSSVNIDYEKWPLVEVASDAGSDAILRAYSTRIEEAKQKGGYTSVDLVDVNQLTPGLDEMLAKFNREHWHDEDEVRFTVAGQGVFHIHPPDGPVIAIEVGPGDMIRVPKGTRHWFDLCATKQIKAIRFFQNKAGWTPYYTGSTVAEGYQPVCLGPQYIPHSGV
jgi:1,2-dihydroxy-3-keto-5-methylthiopentene dioxygenase